jgi:hypothetical protein
MNQLLRLAEQRMGAEDRDAAAIYDRVAGRATDPGYEKLRRSATLRMVEQNREKRARKLVWG